MKMLKLRLFLVCGWLTAATLAQSQFSFEQYQQFLQAHTNLNSAGLYTLYPLQHEYYKGINGSPQLADYTYLDSIQIKYRLSPAELDLLQQNHFVVTERLSFNDFGTAFYSVFYQDLPVCITTDAVLHALHISYDQILQDVELAILKPELGLVLDGLHAHFSGLLDKYGDYPELQASLRDIDLYVGLSRSLYYGILQSSQDDNQEQFNLIWQAVQNETYTEMPLFSETARRLDFSQFTVRGHYDTDELRDYFKAMMWLGRIDFLLTTPPDNVISDADIRRMNIDAYLLNELIALAEVSPLLDRHDEIIRFLVGESDNLTPQEYAGLIESQQLTTATQLLDSLVYDRYWNALKSLMGAEQKILSDIFIMDPFCSEPGELPVSYRLLGQRFIIDSYILANVVYDRIIYEGRKIWRPLPDPLDAMFVLGNENAAYLLEDTLELYHYASQLNALRYLVDSYDNDFWETSLYNVWLQAIRYLNAPEDFSGYPVFMQTAAWQHEKLNTQLASWSQLRHDNLLYAKQSYTGGAICSYPHSWIEPYPEFYEQLEVFAINAYGFFTQPAHNLPPVAEYFTGLQEIMHQLGDLAQKELQGIAFDAQEIEFLKSMLFTNPMCGAPPFDGWYARLFYNPYDTEKADFIIADVHTQPTDQGGNIVGRVLHVGTGQVNLGVFLANSPSQCFEPMAYVGPLMSYYEKITAQFDRFTDKRWAELVEAGQIPARPDWVNIYLADGSGAAREPGRELPSTPYFSGLENPDPHAWEPEHFDLLQNYPNPFNNLTTIAYQLPEPAQVNIAVYDLSGRLVKMLVNGFQTSGYHKVEWDASGQSSGIYLYQISAGEFSGIRKCVLLK